MNHSNPTGHAGCIGMLAAARLTEGLRVANRAIRIIGGLSVPIALADWLSRFAHEFTSHCSGVIEGVRACSTPPSLTTQTEFQAAKWLRNRHLQTLYAACILRPPAPPYRREVWTAPDGERIDLDWIDGPDDAPLVVLFHGLEGSSRSTYATALMNAVRERGWRGVVPHFRGCGDTPTSRPRAYHSGDVEEVGWILERLAKVAGMPVHVAGVSLGGNALLKWLAAAGNESPRLVRNAVAVCAPVDLVASAGTLNRGFNRIYAAAFLRSLKSKALAHLRLFPSLAEVTSVARARDLRAFVDAYTAPVHGFADAMDHWTRASSKPGLLHIAVPTLLVSPLDDPLMPADALPRACDLPRHVRLEQPRHGGHVGFVSGPFPGHLDWLPARLLAFFGQSAAVCWSRSAATFGRRERYDLGNVLEPGVRSRSGGTGGQMLTASMLTPGRGKENAVRRGPLVRRCSRNRVSPTDRPVSVCPVSGRRGRLSTPPDPRRSCGASLIQTGRHPPSTIPGHEANP